MDTGTPAPGSADATGSTLAALRAASARVAGLAPSPRDGTPRTCAASRR